jgi:predicted nucleic acid-binding protein
MLLIVSDTSPLRYLVQVGAIDLLPRLYGEVLTTPEVLGELRQGRFPADVRQWADSPPSWLKIESPAIVRFLESLDAGEATALSLAVERHADVLLVDERKAARVAHDCGLATAGTLAVLRDAALSGMVNFRETIDRLTHQTEFHHTRALIDRVIAEVEAQIRQQTRKP